VGFTLTEAYDVRVYNGSSGKVHFRLIRKQTNEYSVTLFRILLSTFLYIIARSGSSVSSFQRKRCLGKKLFRTNFQLLQLLMSVHSMY